MKKFLVSIAASAALFAPMAVAGPASATVPTFKSCDAMHEVAKYKGGVAVNGKVRNTKVVNGIRVPAKSKYRPAVNAAVYRANIGLDRDKDGIACER